jgi:excisionase family DNA binding protein
LDDFGRRAVVKASSESLKCKENQRVVDHAEDDVLVFTIEEAGRRLGLGRAASYAHAKAGHIPTVKLGNRTLVPKKPFLKMFDPV